MREAERSIPVYKKVDVVVNGSGPGGLGAAGTAAAIAVKQGVSPGQVDIPTLRKQLQSQGIDLRKDAIDQSEIRRLLELSGIKISHMAIDNNTNSLYNCPN